MADLLGDKKKANILVIAGFAVFVACNVVYDHFGGWGDVWYIGQSVAFVCYSAALWVLNRSWITELLVVATLGQLADELFGDPTKPDGIEYWFFGAYAVYVGLMWFIKKMQ